MVAAGQASASREWVFGGSGRYSKRVYGFGRMRTGTVGGGGEIWAMWVQWWELQVRRLVNVDAPSLEALGNTAKLLMRVALTLNDLAQTPVHVTLSRVIFSLYIAMGLKEHRNRPKVGIATRDAHNRA